MASDRFPERFLQRLRELAKDAPQGRVSSATLESSLGWKREKLFSNTRQQLEREGRIRTSRGGGGGLLEPVGDPPAPRPKKINAFVSYSHKDKDVKTQLLKHLGPLTRQGLVEHWHDGEIKVGDEWEKEILDRLGRADLIVLLISVDFINSNYCYEIELGKAIARHDQRKAKIVPVIVRSCLWEDLPFGKIQAALKGLPVTNWAHQDDALADVAREIRDLILSMREPAARAA
jgi:hypothetical protein